MTKPKAALFNEDACDGQSEMIDYVYGRKRIDQLAELTDLHPQVVSSHTLADILDDLEVIFSTWGMPALTEEQIARLSSLEAVFYAAGSVKGFARPFLEAGVTVTSAWAANAIPVAEFALAQILLSCKGYFRNMAACRSPERHAEGDLPQGPGIYNVTVAIIGAGQVGRKLIELLRPFRLDVLVVDPYLSEKEVEALGVERVSLEEAFRRAYVVSNHLPNLPHLEGILHGALFEQLPLGATFINTGRGAQVVEGELVAVLGQRPDLTALLDVTDPEPPPSDSPLYKLPNVHLSSHIAGSVNNEVGRLADYAIAAFKEWHSGQVPRYRVTLDMLRTMA